MSDTSPAAHFAAARFGSTARITLRVEGGGSGLRFDVEEGASDLRVQRRDGRYVRLMEGY